MTLRPLSALICDFFSSASATGGRCCFAPSDPVGQTQHVTMFSLARLIIFVPYRMSPTQQNNNDAIWGAKASIKHSIRCLTQQSKGTTLPHSFWRVYFWIIHCLYPNNTVTKMQLIYIHTYIHIKHFGQNADAQRIFTDKVFKDQTQQ